jgi:phosphoenolpyruvate-protein phosphotransferase
MRKLHGIPASPGLVVGHAHIIQPFAPVDEQARHAGDSQHEQARLEHAIAQAMQRLDALQHNAHGPTADILLAQREMLDDPELKQGAIELIQSGLAAEAAITLVAARYAEQLASLPDIYLAARAEDVRESGHRIVAALRGTSLEVHLTQPAILVARDLAPAETVELNSSLLQGIVTEGGSATGHLAIVAQGLDIPAVVGVVDLLQAVKEGDELIVDGGQGKVIIAPNRASHVAAEKQITAQRQAQQELAGYRERQGVTADGTHVEIFANIGSLAEAHKAVEMGAEGVGLFRTELLAAQGLPSEEEQYKIYREVAAALQRPLIVRTFDIGGDKPVPGLAIPEESNPFLGWRGIRLGLDRPQEIFLPQIRALLRVAAEFDVRIMFPMVALPSEVEQARTLVTRAAEELQQAGQPMRARIPLGIMVETPAAALTLNQFKGLVDFASIGTNDLVQYTYAVDRTNAQVKDRAQPLGTAIVYLIERICQAGIPVAVCGQLAGDEEAIPVLVGLGVRELSVAPARVPAVKRLLSKLTLAQMQQAARARL